MDALAAKARKGKIPVLFVGGAGPSPALTWKDPVLFLGSWPVDQALRLADALVAPCGTRSPALVVEDTPRGRELAAALVRNIGHGRTVTAVAHVPPGQAPGRGRPHGLAREARHPPRGPRGARPPRRDARRLRRARVGRPPPRMRGHALPRGPEGRGKQARPRPLARGHPHPHARRPPAPALRRSRPRVEGGAPAAVAAHDPRVRRRGHAAHGVDRVAPEGGEGTQGLEGRRGARGAAGPSLRRGGGPDAGVRLRGARGAVALSPVERRHEGPRARRVVAAARGGLRPAPRPASPRDVQGRARHEGRVGHVRRQGEQAPAHDRGGARPPRASARAATRASSTRRSATS